MNGIDISSHQGGIDPAVVAADFVIVKVSQGTSYENPFWREHAARTLESGKLLGLYHYAAGGDCYAEANFFLSLAGDYIGQALLCLDWEEGQNVSWASHNNWTYPWLKYVEQQTGTTPVLYVQASAMGVNDTGYPLWIAQYPDYQPVFGYIEHPWNEGAYSCAIRQYTSQGYIDGYWANLDLNKSYIDRETWISWQGGRYEGSTHRPPSGDGMYFDESEEEMKPTIIGLDGEPTLYVFEGGHVMQLESEEQMDTYRAFYQQRFGYEVPTFYWGDKGRFEAFLKLYR